MSSVISMPAPEKNLNNAIKALALEAIQDDLTPTDIEARCKALADEYGVSIKAVRDQFRTEMPANGRDLQGTRFDIPDMEPWESPVGPEVLLEIKSALHQHLHLTSEEAALAVLWAAHTHCFKEFQFTPRLAISAPDKGCGKSVLLDVLGLMVNKRLPASSMTPATMFRVIERYCPTLMIDEVDSWLNKDTEMTSMLNGGVNEQSPVLRTVGDDHEPMQFHIHAPVAMAGINLQKKLAEATKDRTLWIAMERAMPTDIPEKYNRREHDEKFAVLGRKLARWVQDNLEDIRECDPSVTPEHMINRTQDRWEPMFMLAACAGGDWDKWMRLAYERQPSTSQEERGVRMLADLRQCFRLLGIWASSGGGIHTHFLRECLLSYDPEEEKFTEDGGGDANLWRNHNFKKSFDERYITARQINDILKRFIKGEKPKTVRMPAFNINDGPRGSLSNSTVMDETGRGWDTGVLFRAMLRWEPEEMKLEE